MVNKAEGQPKGDTESNPNRQSYANREKITLILQKAVKVVHINPSAIMERVARIINKPSMNPLARMLSLLVAENAPETLLENEHIIRGQKWKNTILQIAMSNMSKDNEESE